LTGINDTEIYCGLSILLAVDSLPVQNFNAQVIALLHIDGFICL